MRRRLLSALGQTTTEFVMVTGLTVVIATGMVVVMSPTVRLTLQAATECVISDVCGSAVDSRAPGASPGLSPGGGTGGKSGSTGSGASAGSPFSPPEPAEQTRSGRNGDSCGQEWPPYSGTTKTMHDWAYEKYGWRSDDTSLDKREFERLSKDTAYMDGPEFLLSLRANDLELVDRIDNQKTGLQAFLIRDMRSPGTFYVLFRGTENPALAINQEWNDALAGTDSKHPVASSFKDLTADFDRHVGLRQFYDEEDHQKLADWAAKHQGQLTVTGHSLGGTLAERFALEFPSAVRAGYLYNAPPVEQETMVKAVTVARRIPPLYVYEAEEDIVRFGGYGQHPGRVFVAETGLPYGLAAHGVMIACTAKEVDGWSYYKASNGWWYTPSESVETGIRRAWEGVSTASGQVWRWAKSLF